jgi:hypothetical protein
MNKLKLGFKIAESFISTKNFNLNKNLRQLSILVQNRSVKLENYPNNLLLKRNETSNSILLSQLLFKKRSASNNKNVSFKY